MAFLKRDLYPEVTRANRHTLVFDTDSNRLYIELEMTHSNAAVGGTVDHQIATMDIADYLNQGEQTAGHRELWRLLRALFGENSDQYRLHRRDVISGDDVQQIPNLGEQP